MSSPSDFTKRTLSAFAEGATLATVLYLTGMLLWDALATGIIRGKSGFSCAVSESSLCYTFSVAGLTVLCIFLALGAWVAFHDLFRIRLAPILDKTELVVLLRSKRLSVFNWLVLPLAVIVLATIKLYEYVSAI